jgi:hypothetical protein
VTSSITGTSIGRGGGGGGYSASTTITTATNGGGAGGLRVPLISPQPGAINTGGGGGGGGHSTGDPAREGGSGIVIVRYAI